MPEFAIFEMSDGTTTINLLQGANVGFHLKNWTPAIAQAKGGGTFQSSSLSTGRRLADRKFDNIIDSFDLSINGTNQNQVIFEIQEAFRLLEKATQYWTTDWQSDPVWIKAQAKCEDNPRYALIVDYKWEELDNPYAQPFYTPFQLSVMDNITLVLEHKHWMSNRPNTESCIQVGNLQTWEYDAEWLTKTSAGASIHGIAIRAANDYLYMGDTTNVLRSIDNGENWAINTALPTGLVIAMVQLANGDILAGDGASGNIFRTQDNGASWGTPGAVSSPATSGINWLMQLANGDILAFYADTTAPNDTFNVDVSVDGGATWANRFATSRGQFEISKAIQLANGDLLAADWSGGTLTGGIYKSDDNGVSWDTIFRSTLGGSDRGGFLLLDNGNLLFISNSGAADLFLYQSQDNGDTWGILFDFAPLAGDVGLLGFSSNSLFQDSGDILYIATSGGAGNRNVFSSNNNGESWRLEYTLSNSNLTFAPVVEAANGQVLQGEGGGVIRGKDANSTTAGSEGLCSNGTFIANKINSSQLTHIKIEDNSLASFTDIYPIAAFPQELFPNPIEQNDAIYFGIDPDIVFTDGVFNNLVFDIGTTTLGEVDYGTWQYWDGAWTALPTVGDDTMSDRTLQFSNPGINSVCWNTPSDWATTTVDGITAYWVRLIVLGASPPPIQVPTQINRQIYTTTWAYGEVLAAQIEGDIPALLRARIYNTSCEFAEIPSPSRNEGLWSNRLIVGLRSVNRGSLFQAFLNASDVVFDGVAPVTLGTNTTFQTDITTPTGRYSQYNPAGVEAMDDRVTFSLSPSVTDDFRGIYHVFLRVQRTAGAIADFDIQLQIVGGSGGVTFTTKSEQIQDTTAWELLDFGRIQIPTGNINDASDITEIRVQASAASGTPNLNIYDLVLIPVDEWAGDFIDFQNNESSIVGATPNLAFSKFLDIDSVTELKIAIKSPVRRGDGTDFKTTDYNPFAPGEAILQANAQQKLWILSARTSATGTSFQWLSEPWILHSIQLTGNERYLGLKGER